MYIEKVNQNALVLLTEKVLCKIFSWFLLWPHKDG